MSVYTLRRTWPDDPDRQDWVFRFDGHDVGRCQLSMLAGNVTRWRWTIYIGIHAKRAVEDVPIAGFADTLDEAKQQFRNNFDRMIAAGVVECDGWHGPK